ncbi:MAG: hypothetical protein ACTHM7_14215 [Ginsengibacter sp.]
MNTKKQKLNPSTIAKNLGMDGRFIIMYPENSGYSYKIFWQRDKADKLEIVGSSAKIYKTKGECIKIIKKLTDCFPSGFGSGIRCYDHKGNGVDIEIKYDIKKLL